MAPTGTPREGKDEKDEEEEKKPVAEASKGRKRKKKEDDKKKASKGILGGTAELVPVLILGYFTYIGKHFYTNLYPTFPDFDANHRYIDKFQNRLEVAQPLKLKVYVKESKSRPTIARDAQPDWTVDFKYEQEDFVPAMSKVTANVSQKLLDSTKNIWLTGRLLTEQGERIAEAHGKMIKYSKMKPIPTKYWMLTGNVCEEGGEKAYGTKAKPLTARGIPQMQVRLVYDRTAYPYPWKNAHYYPQMYVDEFWMTDDQLIKFNQTGVNRFGVEMHFGLMSAARWRFQMMMEQSFAQNAKLFGEDAEEMVAMRDLFANTHPYLLVATMVVSVLHCIFEYLALKSDVAFWNKTDAETLKKFVSLRAVVLEIICNVVLLIYLYDQESNFLVLILSLGQILVDCWKVTRVVEVSMKLACGFLPYPSFKSKVPHSSSDDYDKIALTYLSYILVPIISGYAIYSAMYECHKSWYSYILHVSASCVYALGFALMTPQLFINYRMKSVANLPWRRFVYRAINTFIDDLFSFIIKMPTMHRMSCFRDDIVFIVYLYQRHIYPVDKKRNFDDDIVDDDDEEEEEADGQQEQPESKKSK